VIFVVEIMTVRDRFSLRTLVSTANSDPTNCSIIINHPFADIILTAFLNNNPKKGSTDKCFINVSIPEILREF
jgi:hypothetical protein